jgi:hypothetical protein
VDVASGSALIVTGSVLGLFTVFVLWHRVPAGLALSITSICGMCLAAGGLLVQEDVGPASWVVALVLLAISAPLHARLVFGMPGRPRGTVVARGAPAA